MRVLVYSSLYPNSEQPHHGIFVERRVQALRERTGWYFEVVAPVPWFPLRDARWGSYARFARVPLTDSRDGITVHHPRYLVVPRVSWRLAPFLLYFQTRALIRKLSFRGAGFDLMDAHFAFPDGVAAVMLGAATGLPVLVTARGSDINDSPRYFLPRIQIRRALRRASALAAVAGSLADDMARLGGLSGDAIHVLPNGVDRTFFRPRDKMKARERFDLAGPVILSVGNLRLLKGHHLLIEALAGIEGATLVIAGGGEERARLEACARHHGVAQRVRFMGVVGQADLPDLYSAADVFALASSSEGCPNVVLEAMACGLPVVATRVGAIPEMLPDAGLALLAEARTAACLRERLIVALGDAPPSSLYTQRADDSGWDRVCQDLARVMTDASAKPEPAGGHH